MAKLLIGETIFEIDSFYKEGALFSRARKHYNPPYRNGSNADAQWRYGYDNEEAGEHFRFGVDVLTARKPADYEWKEDSSIPRAANGCVDRDWYKEQLSKVS